MKVQFRSLRRLALIALFAGIVSGTAYAQNYLPKMGGDGGGAFDAPCGTNENLTGFEIRTGDDIDKIRPVCVIAYGPAQISAPLLNVPLSDPSWHGGDGGGHMQSLLCPPRHPVVLGIEVLAQGVTVVIQNLHLFCGDAMAAPQPISGQPSAEFDGNTYLRTGASTILGDAPRWDFESQHCDPGQVAVGMHGRSGTWVDSIGLICDQVRLTTSAFSFGYTPLPPKVVHPTSIPEASRPTVNLGRVHPSTVNTTGPSVPSATVAGSIGRVRVPATAPIPICDSARSAMARNSPAAPNLEAQCRAAGGDPKYPGGIQKVALNPQPLPPRKLHTNAPQSASASIPRGQI